MSIVAKIIESDLLSNGGASVTIKGNKPKGGFMVSVPGKEFIVNGKPSEYQIADYIASVKPADNEYIGAWYDGTQDRTYLDISENIADIESAVKLGKQNNQLSIYNLDTGDVIWL